MSRQTILMCAPDYFDVTYVINPWMQNQIGHVDKALAIKQWNNLRDNLAKQAELAFQPPKPGVPDLVFTANAAFVLDKLAIISKFRSPERQPEEAYDLEWFQQNHFQIAEWSPIVVFEGAGDALLDRREKVIWVGNGFRSDITASAYVEVLTERRTVNLKLIDPRFYHLDTCFCPLEDGWLMYYPPAFDKFSQDKIAAIVPEDKRIVVSSEDALHFACNAVDLNRHIFMNAASDDLQNRLGSLGFTPVVTPLSEFLKAGGGAKCLTLKLVET